MSVPSYILVTSSVSRKAVAELRADVPPLIVTKVRVCSQLYSRYANIFEVSRRGIVCRGVLSHFPVSSCLRSRVFLVTSALSRLAVVELRAGLPTTLVAEIGATLKDVRVMGAL